MRRKKKHKEHPVKPDWRYGSPIVGKLINKVMRRGEKRIATRIVYQAAEIIEKWVKANPEKLKKEIFASKKDLETKQEEKKKKNSLEPKLAIEPTKELTETPVAPFLTILERALANVKPEIEMRTVRHGATNRRIPKIIDENRSLKIVLCWLVESAKEKRTTKTMAEELAEEIINAYQGSGKTFKKKEELYKAAETGRVFARSSNR